MRGYRDRHREALIDATVRIRTVGSSGNTVESGTGFFVAPGLVVTCAHVVPDLADRTPPAGYVVEYNGVPYPATDLVREPALGAEKVFAEPDVALLEIACTDHLSMPLATAAPQQGRELFAYGCPQVAANRWAWDHIPLSAEGTMRLTDSGRDWIKTTYGQVRPGASGSGVIDVGTGALVGMLAQTRGEHSDLGGMVVSTEVILRTLADAGHDVTARNADATRDALTLADLKSRLDWVFQRLAEALADVSPTHLVSMVKTIEQTVPDPLDLDDATIALVDRELDDLGRALEALARARGSAREPMLLLAGAAALSTVNGRPWVEPPTAAALRAERASDNPRVVHLPVTVERSVHMHVARAAVDGVWSAERVATCSAEVDPASGLPVHLIRAVRATLMQAMRIQFDGGDPDSIDQRWAQRGQRALKRAREVLVVLPTGMADAAAVRALRTQFAPCLFLVTDEQLPAKLAQDATTVLALPPSLADEVEADAQYQEISDRIEDKAMRGSP